MEMTRDEWCDYCRAEATGDAEAMRELIRKIKEREEQEDE